MPQASRTINRSYATMWTSGIGWTNVNYYLETRDWMVSEKRVRPKTYRDRFINGTYWHKKEIFRLNSPTIVVYPTRPQTGLKLIWQEQYIPFSVRHSSLQLGFYTPSAQMTNRINAKARHTGVNLALMLAEYRETAGLFKSLVDDVSKATRKLLRRNPGLKNAKSISDIHSLGKRVSREHLRYVYGVAPLMHDLNESLQTLKEGLNTNLEFVVDDKYVSRSRSEQVEYVNTHSTSVFDIERRTVVVATIKRERAVALVKLKNSPLVNTMSQLGFTNLAALAWERVPYSFVVDWWFNVGEVLASLDNLLLLDEMRVIYSKKESAITEVFGWAGSSLAVDSMYVRMPPQTSSGVARLAYKPSISYQHIANGLALMIPFMSRLRK